MSCAWMSSAMDISKNLKRIHDPSSQTYALQRDVRALEDALMFHKETIMKDETSLKGMLRKETGGPRWQYGGMGKLTKFRSAKDLDVPKNPEEKVKKRAKSEQYSAKDFTVEPSGISTGPGSAMTKPLQKRKSLGDDSSRSKPRTERVRSASADPGKSIHSQISDRPKTSADSNSTRSHMMDRTNKPLVGPAKAAKIKAASKEKKAKEQENGFGQPMKIMVTKKNGTDSFERKVLTGSGIGLQRKMDKPTETRDMVCDLKISVDDQYQYVVHKERSDVASLMATDFRSKTRDTGSKDGKCDPDVALWIKGLKLKDPDKYIQLFAGQEIDMDALRLINEKHLRAIGVTAVGPLNKLMQGIRDLRGDTFERYLEQFDSSRSDNLNVQGRGQDQKREKLDQKNVKKEKKLSERNRMKKGDLKLVSETGKADEKIDAKKADGLDTIPVKEPKDGKGVARKNSFQTKETLSFEQKKREKILEVKKTARERMVTHKKAEKEKVLKKKTDVPVQSREFEGDTAVGLYGQSVSSAEPTPRPGEEAVESRSNPTSPVESLSKNPWSSSVSIRPAGDKDDPDILLKSIETQVRGLQLQGKANEVVTKDLIERLQNQLRAIQVQVSDKPSLEVLESTKNDLKALEKARIPKDSKSSEQVLPFTSTRTSPPRPKSTLLSSMTKHELIGEVRKQKQEYDKQLKHLESELGRLKQTDPVKSCEVPIEDIYINEDDVIGEGAFSKVYRGTFQGVEVAIKRLMVPLERHDKNYFAGEVSLLRELRHPHVVLLVGVCTTASLPLMVLEYMGGGSLYDTIHDPSSPAYDHVAYCNIAKDISLGMNYLHRHRPAVLHLDLKSMNVLLTIHERAKIADFGFSKLRHEADMAASRQGRSRTNNKGTPAWMAPEMLSGGDVTIKADVYSFGIILWEMLTREHPYDGCSTFQVLERLRTNKRPNIPPDCPPTLSDLITSCWSHNPARRPQFKDILLRLEDITFPPEWRTLFEAANVPKLALEDIESAREIVGFVNTTLERDLESLNSSRDGEESALPVPQLDLKVIDLEEEGSEEYYMRQNPESREDQVSLGSWETDRQTESSGQNELTPRSEQEVRSSDSWELDQMSTQEPVAAEGGNIPAPPPLPASLPPVKSKQPVGNAKKVAPMKAPAKVDTEPKVRAQDLIAQRLLLQSTSHPHPCQLRDLNEVPAERLNSIALILRQAVEKRRQAMKEGATTDRSSEGGAWSTAESSRPETFRTYDK